MKKILLFSIFFSFLFSYQCLSERKIKFYKNLGLSYAEIEALDKKSCEKTQKRKPKTDTSYISECDNYVFSYTSFLKNSVIGRCYKISYCRVFQKPTYYSALCKNTYGDVIFLGEADKLRQNHTYAIVGKYEGEMTYKTVIGSISTVPLFKIIKSKIIY